MEQNKHQLAAIVFTDIVGYTKQMEQDEERTMQLLQQQREIVFPIVESHGGKVIKEIGDGLLIMFHSAIHAVRCAIAIQDRLKDEELTIRAGIHIGDVIFKKDDVFGSAVNTAARIEPLAPANGICISEQVRSQIRNKDDIKTFSMGKKELKGVDNPIEIFCIASSSIDLKQPSTVSIVKDLWKRKVLQIAIAYLALSWIIKLAVSSIVTSFMLSPYLVDLVWIILLSLSPTVLLITYFHGKTKEKWNRIEKIGLPLNLIASVLLAVFLFNGKDLGAATVSVTVENEDGDKIERVIYKDEFRKKIAIFFYDNVSGDTSLNWMQYAFSTALNYDLSQNTFIQTQHGEDFIKNFEDAGYNSGVGAPFMLLKDIAKFYNLNHFITGSFNFVDDQYHTVTKLYETNDARLISTIEYSGKNFFELIDNISKRILTDIKLPSSQVKRGKDMPISINFTESVKAMEYFIKGTLEVLLNNNYELAIKLTESAVKEDPGFAIAHFVLSDYYFNNNNVSNAEIALDNALKNIYKLPERQQFKAKYYHYQISQEPEKATAVLKMWCELIPEDIYPHELLSERYQYNNEYQKAIKEYQEILKLDPSQTKFTRYIGHVYKALGNTDSAFFYFNQYIEQNPDNFRGYRDLGELYLFEAKFDSAKEYIDRASIMNINDIDIALTQVSIDIRTGNFKNIEERYSRLLKKSNSAEDSCAVYEAISKYYEFRGQVFKSLQMHEAYIDCLEKVLRPLNFVVIKMFNVNKYIIAGKEKEAFEIIKSSEEIFEPPVDKVISYGYMFYYLHTNNVELAEPYIEPGRELAIGFGEEMLLSNIYYIEGHIYEARGDYENALKSFDQFIERTANALNIYQHIARVQREMGNLKKAKKTIQFSLKHFPYNPKVNFEAYLIYREAGDDKQALEYLKLSNEIWKDADPIYKPANKAKDELMRAGV